LDVCDKFDIQKKKDDIRKSPKNNEPFRCNNSIKRKVRKLLPVFSINCKNDVIKQPDDI